MSESTVQCGTLIKVFASLMGLLLLTVGANLLNLGAFSIVVALGIAVAKALLIILFFMEVRYRQPMIWLFAGAGFSWLMILLVLMMLDYTSRPWGGQPNWLEGTRGKTDISFPPGR